MYKKLTTLFVLIGFMLTALVVFLPQLYLRNNPQRDPVKKPNDWFMLQRMWPQNSLNRAAVEAARTQALKLKNETRSHHRACRSSIRARHRLCRSGAGRRL